MYFQVKNILKSNCYHNTKRVLNYKFDAYQFMKSTNSNKVMSKTIISPRTELTKNVVLDLMFFIIRFYDIKHNSKFEC
jgi:hypothetical protein